MLTPYLENLYTLVPLTRDIAKGTKHIAWVEDSDPVKAIRAMGAAIRRKPCNAAVWANAGDTISAESKALVRQWRAASGFSCLSSFMAGYARLEHAEGGLCDAFSRAAAAPGLDALHDHMRRRIRQIWDAFNVDTLEFAIRAGDTDHTVHYVNAHADGSGAPSRVQKIRLIESIESQSTCLVPNNQAQCALPTPEYYGYYRDLGYSEAQIQQVLKTRNWMLKPGKPVTLLQTPENSLTLITNRQHHCDPIVHCIPPTLPGRKAENRTVLVYDFTVK